MRGPTGTDIGVAGASLEPPSEHPLASAVMAAAETRLSPRETHTLRSLTNRSGALYPLKTSWSVEWSPSRIMLLRSAYLTWNAFCACGLHGRELNIAPAEPNLA